MKELDETLIYNLEDLNDEQLREFLNYLKHCYKQFEYIDFDRFKDILHTDDEKSLYFESSDKKWYWCKDDKSTNALTLFEDKKEEVKLNLQIGDTFEHEGYICEYKEKIDEEIWVLNTSTKAFIKVKKFYSFTHKEITDQEFIKQLEKYSK